MTVATAHVQTLVEGVIWRAATTLAGGTVPLNVHLVKGRDGAAWVDSGISTMFPALQATMAAAGVRPDHLKLVLNTHSHHDHIGCNSQLRNATSCLLAAPGRYAHWHSSFERQYAEFARPFPDLVPDTPELREEVLGVLDGEHDLDLLLEEGLVVQLGGGVALECLGFPGHMESELGWLERASRTLILGDAVPGIDWSFHHSYLDVQALRRSLARIGLLIQVHQVERVLCAHYPPMAAPAFGELLVRVERYVDGVEADLVRLLASSEEVSLAELWRGLCERIGKVADFRALNMVHAHLADLIERGLVAQSGQQRYRLR